MGTKRCAVDVDFKIMVAHKKIRSGGNHCASDSLRSGDSMAAVSGGRRWEDNILCAQLAANVIVFSSPPTVSILCDGKRLGCPDEETKAYYL